MLHNALMELPEEKREVLILSRYQDLKYEEIAQMMDCEVNTIKVRVHRALQELREIFHALESGKLVRKPGTRGIGSMAQFREFAMTQNFEEMQCEEIGGLMPDYLHNKLQPEQANIVKAHLEGCGSCAEEVSLWTKLGTIPEAQPSPALASRFNAMLETYQEGRWEHRNLQNERNKFS